jgi:hypothetical protein
MAIHREKQIELMILRLAAAAVDIRGQLTPREISKKSNLTRALDACEALFDELGWGPEQANGSSKANYNFLG